MRGSRAARRRRFITEVTFSSSLALLPLLNEVEEQHQSAGESTAFSVFMFQKPIRGKEVSERQHRNFDFLCDIFIV